MVTKLLEDSLIYCKSARRANQISLCKIQIRDDIQPRIEQVIEEMKNILKHNKNLVKKLNKAITLLHRLEWSKRFSLSTGRNVCPVCNFSRESGHDNNCGLEEIIKVLSPNENSE